MSMWISYRPSIKLQSLHLILHKDHPSLTYLPHSPTFLISDSSHTRLLRVFHIDHSVSNLRIFTFAFPSVQNTDLCPPSTIPSTFKNQLVSRPNLPPYSYVSPPCREFFIIHHSQGYKGCIHIHPTPMWFKTLLFSAAVVPHAPSYPTTSSTAL